MSDQKGDDAITAFLGGFVFLVVMFVIVVSLLSSCS